MERYLGRPRRRPPRAPAAGLLGLVALVGLLVGSGLPVGASSVRADHHAPFGRATASTTLLRVLTGCGRLSAARLTWKLKTGVGHGAENASARRCPGGPGPNGTNSTGAAESYLYLTIPVRAPPGSNVPSSLEVNWTIDAGLTATLPRRATGCPAPRLNGTTGNGSQLCFLGAWAGVELGGYLTDLSNGSVFYPSNFWAGLWAEAYDYNFTSCIAFVCGNLAFSYSNASANAGPVLPTLWINATLDHAHRYQLVTFLYTSLSTQLLGYRAGVANASLDLATGRHEFVLDSYTMR